MLDYIKNNITGFFEDIRYNGKRMLALAAGKEGIAHGATVAPELLGASQILNAVFSQPEKQVALISAPLAAAFSAGLVQLDHVHRLRGLRTHYKDEIAARLKEAGIVDKAPDQITKDDMHLVADGDLKRGLTGNPTLKDAISQSRLERNISIGLSIISTVATTLAVAGMKAGGAFSTAALPALLPEIVASTVVAVALYFAIKTPLHWVAGKIFGLEKETVNDKIASVGRARAKGKTVSQEKVFGVFVEAHPELAQQIKNDYGAEFSRLSRDNKRAVLEGVGPQIDLSRMTAEINDGRMKPQELAFAVYQQHSGVALRDVSEPPPVNEMDAVTKALSSIAHVMRSALHRRDSQGAYNVDNRTETAAVTAPQTAADPAYAAVAAQSRDGNEQVAMQAMHEDQPDHKSSFVEMVGRKVGDDGVSHVQRVEQSRSVQYTNVSQTV